MALKVLVKGRSPPKRLEFGMRNGLYVIVTLSGDTTIYTVPLITDIPTVTTEPIVTTTKIVTTDDSQL